VALDFYFCSTFADLTEHRRAAIAAFRDFAQISKSSHVDYEFFDPEATQGKASTLDAWVRQVSEADYFVLILGWRYGYVPEDNDKSVVELEYEAAVDVSIPIFCFIISDDYPVSPKHIETGEGATKLKALKKRVQDQNLAVRFTSPADLAQKLTLAIAVLNRPMKEATQALIEHPALSLENKRLRDEATLLQETVDFYKAKLQRIVPTDPIWKGRKFQIDTSLCFVLMPFSDPFFLNYDEAILPALESAGLRGVHAGEIFGNRDIMEDIWDSICACRLVIADVTGRNANAFYELGIAHTLEKECVVITQNAKDVPFDISARRYLLYDTGKLAALRMRLEKTIKNILI